ncbi:MAG: DUF3000 family protein [Actinobacteria bacterium]|nr:DUF3000 family protein [Actinomycetota bacterium]MSZ22717.1 DUF3000 family protein [Actinomycetota bacterium]
MLAMSSLKNAATRDELIIEQIAAPGRLAKFEIAFSAQVDATAAGVSSDLGTGRFILLWDEQEPEPWQSKFRVITFAKSPLETNIGADELISDVAWAWLTESLENRNAAYIAEAGTATRIISSGYGALSNQSDHAELEIRASWSPTNTNAAAHLEAWQDLVCIMSGLPNLPAGVSSLGISR